MAGTRHTVRERARLLEDWRRSELSAAAFCRKRGIPYQSFLRWKAEGAQRIERKKRVPAFVEVEMEAPLPTPAVALPAESTVVELTLGAHTVLRIVTGAGAKR